MPPGFVMILLTVFGLAFVLWPLISIGLFFRSYMPKVIKVVDRPWLATVKLPDWVVSTLFIGFLAGLFAFMIVLAAAAFYQSWSVLGEREVGDWLDRLLEVLQQP